MADEPAGLPEEEGVSAADHRRGPGQVDEKRAYCATYQDGSGRSRGENPPRSRLRHLCDEKGGSRAPACRHEDGLESVLAEAGDQSIAIPSRPSLGARVFKSM